MSNGYRITGGKRLPLHQLHAYVTRLRQGDKSIAPEIIKGHYGLAISIGNRYAATSPHKRDDIMATALLSLVQAVDSCAHGRLRDNNITPYLVTRIRGAVLDYLSNDHIVRIPKKTYSKLSEAQMQPLVQTIDVREDTDNPNYEGYDQYVELLQCEDDYDILFMEIIDSMEFDCRERNIIDRLHEGYTLQEIANEIGTTKQNVSIIRNGIKRRLEHYGLCP